TGRWVDMGSASWGYGAQEEADGGTRLRFEVVALFEALADHERVCKYDDRAHDQLSGLARLKPFEFAGLDAVAQDQLDAVALGPLVGGTVIPVLLDCCHHELVDAVLDDQVFLVICEDLKHQPLQALPR